MNKFAVVENGFVASVVEMDADTCAAPTGQVAVRLPAESHVSAGWAYDGSGFTAPEHFGLRPAPRCYGASADAR